MSWDSEFALSILPVLLEGLKVTLLVTAFGMLIALSLGLVIAIGRRLRIPVASRVLDFYVTFVRGTPLLVQAYCVFFILPAYGIRFDALVTGIIVIGINYSAYTAEVYRSGIEGVPTGQWEAAIALNLPTRTTWQRVVLPQAFANIIPMLGNYLIQMFKDSAVLSAITVVELLATALSVSSSTFRYLEPLTVAGLFFLILSYAASQGIRFLEKRSALSVSR